jgi:carboxyl-terminal processing protease
MIESFSSKILMVLLTGYLALPVGAADPAPAATEAPRTSATDKISKIAKPQPVSPGPVDGRIAWVTAKMLEQYHYLRPPFDDSMSSKFLDRYLETLDPQHLHFLQSDLATFERYRNKLDELTADSKRRVGDVSPGCEIYNRFMQRLEQRVVYVDELLKNEQFTFDADERILVNRKDAPYPKDIDEARKLWRERLRFEYLQERLVKIGARKKKDKAENAAREGEAPGPGKESPAAKPDSANAGDTKPAVKPKSEAEEIKETLTRRYHRNLHAFVEWNNEDVLQLYLTTLAHVYDPHSDYLGRVQLEQFAIQMNLSLFGIGAELRSEDGYCTINRLLPGGPAVKSGKIKEKDRIIAVAQSNQPPVDVVDMNLTKAVQLIRGPKGTEVRLTLIPAGADAADSKVISLVRDEIKLEDQEAKAKVIDMPRPDGKGETTRIGVIDLPSFYAPFDPTNARNRSESKSTTSDVGRLIKKLKQEGVKGLVLDLRKNGGGSLEEAIRLTGLFIKEGPVVQVKSWNGNVEVEEDQDPAVLYDGPLIVLTSRFSASASEILAGALQDYGRALIVGDASTHGKGTVQQVNPLKPFMQLPSTLLTNEPGALKITIKKFYRASGASTQLRGVTPDIILPSIWNESKEIGESSLDNPMQWDPIESAKYEALNRVAPYVPELTKRSGERLAVDQEYAYIREDIEQLKKLQADKTVSLNERERLKEREELEARMKARDKERLARKEPDIKVYEVALKQVDLPGLPPPVEKTNTVAKLGGRKGLVQGAATNESVAAAAPSGVGEAHLIEEDSDEEKPAAVDATLGETERILVDYLSLLPRQDVVMQTRPGGGKAPGTGVAGGSPDIEVRGTAQ